MMVGLFVLAIYGSVMTGFNAANPDLNGNKATDVICVVGDFFISMTFFSLALALALRWFK